MNPRASRTADIVASVPELTRRTCSTGARATISSASSHLTRAWPCRTRCRRASGRGDGGHDRRVRVPEDHRPPGADQVDVLAPVHVGQVGPGAADHEPGHAADRAERADRRVHPAGGDLTRAGEQRLAAAGSSGSRVAVTLGLAGVDEVLQQPQRVRQRMLLRRAKPARGQARPRNQTAGPARSCPGSASAGRARRSPARSQARRTTTRLRRRASPWSPRRTASGPGRCTATGPTGAPAASICPSADRHRPPPARRAHQKPGR